MGSVRQLAALMAAAGTLACENRAPAAAAQQQAASTAGPDTIVRRVLRVTPRASSMQRVTGAVRALRPLEPLDSTLTVRVFDQRGREMRAVPVRWTLEHAGEGAKLSVLEAKTDTLGRSSATFVPGLSADPQSAVAEVAGVGRIDFTVTVPAMSVRILPERLTVWSGEDAVLAAELRDEAGRLLPGGTLFWATPDTAALRIRPADATHARVSAVLAGRASVVAWIGAGELRDTAHLTVRPVLGGKFVTLDGRPPPPMAMELRAPSVRATVPVQDGAFGARIELPLESDVEVAAHPLADTGAYHRIRVAVATLHELQNLVIALVPTAWRIDAGTYAGQRIAIDAAAALRRQGRSAPFWRLVPMSGNGPRTLLGWNPSDLPLRLAFDRSQSTEPISAEDSIQFWSIASQMQRDLGATLFAPAELPADSNGASRVNLVPVRISSQESAGHTFVSWTQPGDANNGELLLGHAATLRDSHVVTHELLHLLGFGHAGGWATIALPSGGTALRLTPEDVAYVQLSLRLRQLQRQTGARPGLPVPEQ